MSEGMKFIKDISFLSLWNISSSFIGIFSFYIITNLLGPTEYGKYSLVISLITTISLSAYASVNEALLRFSAITKDRKLVNQCIKIQYIFGLIALVGFLILSLFINKIYQKDINLILVIVSFSFFFTPFIESFKNLVVGRKSIKSLIYLSLSNQLFLIFFALCLFFLNIRSALVMASIYLVVSFLNFLQAKRLVDKLEYVDDGKYNKNELIKYIKNGFLFGLFKNIYFQSALIVGSKFIDAKHIGFYNFSISIAMMSIFAIINAIQILAVPYITSFYEKNEMEKVNSYFNASIKLGLILSIALSGLLYSFLKLVLPYLFPKYVDVLTVLPYILFAFVLLNFNATMSFLKAKGNIAILTKISILSTFFSLINSYLLSKYFGFNGMVISLIVNILFSVIITWYYAHKHLKLNFSLLPTKGEVSAFKLYFGLFINKFFDKLKK